MAKFSSDNLICKILLMAAISLLLLIPLEMIKSLVKERQQNADNCRTEVADTWSRAQTFSGPKLDFFRERTEEEKKNKDDNTLISKQFYPDHLCYEVDVRTQNLHRSIYDVMVYTADVVTRGSFLLPETCRDYREGTDFSLGLSDLRGIEGTVSLSIGGRDYNISRGNNHSVSQRIELDPAGFGSGKEIPFEIRFRTRGSETLYFQPFGDVTDVTVSGDCSSPSFEGDFLPADREIDENGFSARWSVSAINRGRPEDTRFGIRFLQRVSQYQQTTRTAKYGILVVLLVFIAGLAVELVGKKSIHIVQYAVIGLSLVLFYALLLSFSELMAFWLAYLLAAGMTTAALTGYFRGILKNKSAWLLGALVALAYVVCYILLQMETYALVAGTLVLFVILVGIMYFTRDLRPGPKNKEEQEQNRIERD
jgi:inner membrane protein